MPCGEEILLAVSRFGSLLRFLRTGEERKEDGHEDQDEPEGRGFQRLPGF